MKLPALSWLALTIALLAWSGFFFFAWMIKGERENYATAIAVQRESSAKEASLMRARVLVGETQRERSELSEFLNADVISAVDTIEAVGKAARVDMKLGSAAPAQAPVSANLSLRAIGFAIEADGSFVAIMHAAQLLEALPLPSTIDQLSIERAPNSGGWHINVYLRVFTTADISV